MYENENEEVIEFCLKHNLIKKTNTGYVVRRNFFDLIDMYEE
jgi:hypothetical protein